MSVFDIEDKKIWVAGHSGLVGSALLRRLKGEPSEVVKVDHSILDLTRQSDTEDWIAQHKPDAIILAAAKVGGIAANSQYPAEFIYNNLAIAQSVIHGAYKADVQKLLFLGSSCIYPKKAAQPITEDALLTGPLEETNEAYAVAKIAGLKLCEFYRKQYGCDFISAMPTNLYGPGDLYDLERSHVIPALIHKMHKAKMEGVESVEIWGSGNALREFLYVDDLADALVFILKNYSDAAPINIGSGQEYTIAALAETIAHIVGYDGSLMFNASRPEGVSRKCLDSSKLSKKGWQALISLEDGLALTYESYLKTVRHSQAA